MEKQLKIKWINAKTKQRGFVGKIEAFRCFWDVIDPKDKGKPYRLVCMLPQVPQPLRFATKKEAMEESGVLLDKWVKELYF